MSTTKHPISTRRARGRRPDTGTGLCTGAVRRSPPLSCRKLSMLAPQRAQIRKGPGFTFQQCGQTDGCSRPGAVTGLSDTELGRSPTLGAGLTADRRSKAGLVAGRFLAGYPAGYQARGRGLGGSRDRLRQATGSDGTPDWATCTCQSTDSSWRGGSRSYPY